MRRPILLTLIISTVILALYFGLNRNSETTNKKNEQFGRVELLPSELNSDVEQADRPDRASEQDFEMTKDPSLGYPPLERKMAAAKYMQERFVEQSGQQTAIGGVQWTSRGPDNIAGVTKAVMFDPNDPNAKRVFAASTTGGLWTNEDITNPDVQWQNVSTIVDNLTISSIAYDPSNTQIFYLGTGSALFSNTQSRGEGIWKSTDGGANWTQLSGAMNSSFHYVHDVAVTNNGTVLATTSVGLFRSADGGTTWIRQFPNAFGDLEISSDNTIYATEGFVTTDGKIYKSTNNGSSWDDITPSPISGAERIEVASAPSNPDRLYAIGSLFPNTNDDIAWFRKSDDAGATWTDIAIPRYLNRDCSMSTTHFTRQQAWFNLTIAVHPEDPDFVIAGGIDLHRSTNAGADWDPISWWVQGDCPDYDYVHPDIHEFLFRPGNPNETINSNDGGLFYSPDIEAAGRPIFEERNRNFVSLQLYAISMEESFNSDKYIGGSQDNGTILYTNPGLNSSTRYRFGDGTFCFIDKDNSDIAITSNPGNFFELTTDDGATFSTIINQPDVGRFINPAEYDQDAKILYTAGAHNTYVRVSGVTTTPTAPTTITLSLSGHQISTIKASPHTENRIFIGVNAASDQSHIYMVDNANQNAPVVSDISGNFEGNVGNFVSSIEVGATDDQLIITFSNYGVTSVYETTDGGVNWINKEGNLPDIPIRDALYNPNNRSQVLLATEMGVWSTDDFSGTPDWGPTNNGMASVRASMLKYREADQQVAVGTFGRGLFTSNVFANTVDANFKAVTTIGYAGKPVQFEDASILPGDSWAWDFGDGQSSGDQNPSHIYQSPGVYDVSLNVANGANTETKTGYITILASKSAPYSAADGGDFESNESDWASISLLGGINIWERGAPANELSTPSSGSNAWKTDLDADLVDEGINHSAALYSPVFDLSDNTRDYAVNFAFSIESEFCNGPHALRMEYSTNLGQTWQRLGNSIDDFGSENWYFRGPDQGCQIEGVIFEDFTGWAGALQRNINASYKLNFLAGQSTVSFRYIVSVFTGFGGGYTRDGYMIDDFFITSTDPTADFDSNKEFSYTDEEIQFTYGSNGATSFAWDFGDGTSSTDTNPVHAYTTPGRYNVKLTVQTPAGEVVETKSDFVKILPKIVGPLTLEDGGDFESNFDYFIAENIANTPFERGESTIPGKDGTASGSNAWVTDLDATQYLDNSEANLYTPAFDFTILGDYTLQFKAKYRFEATWDGFIVEYSTDLGSTWTKLNNVRESGWYNSTSHTQSIWGAQVPIFSGNFGSSFATYSTDVSDLYPNEFVSFRIVFKTDAATLDVGLAIDDFELLAPVPGPAEVDFTVSGVTGCSGQQVTFTSTSTGSISSLTWDFGENSTPSQANGPGPHTVIYSRSASSTVSLTAVSPVNGTVTETKADFISTAALFTASFEEEDNGDRDIARLVSIPGDAYQWFRGGDAIDGATSQIYLADEGGFYSVAITIGGCTVKSSTLSIITEIEDDPAFAKSITFFPNPVSDIVNIKMSNQNIGKISLAIYDLNGKQISQTFVDKNNFDAEYQISLGKLEASTYLLEIISDDSRSVKRIIKE